MCVWVYINLSWYRHTHTHTDSLSPVWLLISPYFLKTFPGKNTAMTQMRRGTEESRAWWQNADRGREKDEETSNTLLLSPAFSLSAGFYLPRFRCSTETWADIKSDAKKYMCMQTHRRAHLIFTSCAPLASVDISWLPCKLKAHIAEGDSYAFGDAHMYNVAQTHTHTCWKIFHKERHKLILPKEKNTQIYIVLLLTHTHTRAHTRHLGWRWKSLN